MSYLAPRKLSGTGSRARYWPVWLDWLLGGVGPPRMRSVGHVALVFALCVGTLLARAPAEAQRFQVRHYDVEDGLPGSQVHDVVQDAEGRIWIAGIAGVASYDGRTWRSYGLDDGLAWADQAFLLRDSRDRLWTIGRRNPFPPARLDGEHWTEITSPGDLAETQRLHGAALGVDGRDGGDELVYATDSGLLVGRDGRWRRVGPEQGLPSADVYGLAHWQGRLIVATAGGLATFFDRQAAPFAPVASATTPVDRTFLADRPVYALAAENGPDGASRLWLVGDDWLGRLDDRGAFELLADDLPFRPAGRVEATADGLGGLYVFGVERRLPRSATAGDTRSGNGTGLVYYRPAMAREIPATRGLQWLGARHGIETGEVSTVFLDRERNLWIGGEKGLTKLISRRFASWDRSLGLFDDGVTALLRATDGTLVIGHRGGLSTVRPIRSDTATRESPGIARIATRALRLESPDGRRVEPVRDLTLDRFGGLWLAAESAGVLHVEGDLADLESLDIEVFGAENGLRGDATAVLATGDELWVGTDTGIHLRRLGTDDGLFRPLPLPTERLHVRRIFDAASPEQWSATGEAPPDESRRDVRSDPGEGRVVVATDAGLHSFEGGTWRSWRCFGGDGETSAGACDSTFAALRRTRGGWWVGTARGVYQTQESSGRTGRLRSASSAALRDIRRPVFFLVADGADLWVGTDDGVVRVRPGGSAADHFSVHEGLAGREMNRSAGLRVFPGRLWFGSDRGLTVYARAFDRGPRPPPLLHLRGVEAGGELHPLDEPLRLGSEDDLLFRFQAISLVDEERVRYRSRLLGFDDDWSLPQRHRDGELRYANVPPGEYRFEVQALSAAGSWSDVATSAPLTVPRPFWQRGWFLVLCSAALATLIWGIVGFVSERRTSRRLEQEVEVRTAELQASEDRYRKTFRAIEDGVVATDGEGRVRLLNPRAEELTGWSWKEANGRPVDEVLRLHQPVEIAGATTDDPPSGERVSLFGGDLKDTMGPAQLGVLASREGKRRYVEMSASPIASREHGITGLVFAFRDVTRRRRIEEELQRTQKLEAVGILAGGIAHDFNNLLQVLMGNLSLVQEAQRLDPETAGALADADKALARARDLTQQLLTFSRGGAPVREAARIGEVIRDSASFVLRGSSVRGNLDLADDLWVVEIDAGQINQVLHNLLLNAVQAMPGGGEIRITARNTMDVPEPLEPGPHVLIEVADEGVGIPEDHLPRIFDPYFSTKEEGRGLGLASAYAVVKKHDGLLTVRSTPGKGTRFRLYLPRARDAAVDEADAAPRGDAARFHGVRVLLMDDDRVVRRTAGAMLEHLGCEVVAAENGAEALALYDRALDDDPFDLVLMDLTVPGGMGGQDAVERLRSLDPDAVAIVYSGYSTDPVLANYRDYGFDGRLSKPFRVGELKSVLGEVLDKTSTASTTSAPDPHG